jgi:lambda family phage minor tail protein L
MATSSEVYNLIVSGNQSLNTEISSLTPSTPIFFYEIDLNEILPQFKASDQFSNGEQPVYNGILRVYNDYNLYKVSTSGPFRYGCIKWQNNFYYPFPITADGFDYTSAGTLPTPKFQISNLSPDYSSNSFYRYIRMQIESLGDIVGAKFTRIKTFLKYLDGTNFSNGINPFNNQNGIYEVQLPNDIYYIDRKNSENKTIVEYQLASLLDLENVTLPARTIYGSHCPFQYRGEGCCYEYDSRLTSIHSGVYAGVENPGIRVRGLQTAPPVATENNQLFVNNIFSSTDTAGATAIWRLTGTSGNLGLWANSYNYVSGDFIYLQNKNLKYYFVCINNHTSDIFNCPPNKNYWTADSCTKSIYSCRLRWLKNPAFRPVIWPTNRNGETYIQTTNRFRNLLTSVERNNLVFSGVNGVPVHFPRRPGCENPVSEQAHGLPKDANGNYLNGFLPFGGFPGTNQPAGQ